MNAEDYLIGLNEHDPVFEIDTDYEYTEQQLINFAERYHQAKLKLLGIADVSQQRELLAFIEEVSTFDALPSSTRLRIRAKELLKANCG